MRQLLPTVMAALDAAIHVFAMPKTWMDGSSPSMTPKAAEGVLT
jgi:hypothetical protein